MSSRVPNRMVWVLFGLLLAACGGGGDTGSGPPVTVTCTAPMLPSGALDTTFSMPAGPIATTTSSCRRRIGAASRSRVADRLPRRRRQQGEHAQDRLPGRRPDEPALPRPHRPRGGHGGRLSERHQRRGRQAASTRLACAPGTPAAGGAATSASAAGACTNGVDDIGLHARPARRPRPAHRHRRPSRLRQRLFQRRGDDAAARLRGRRHVRRDRAGLGREPVRARRLRARRARRRARHPRHARQTAGRTPAARAAASQIGTLRVGGRHARRLGGAQRLRCRPRRSTTLPPLPGVNDGTSVVRHDYAACAAGGDLEHLEVVGNGHYWPDGYQYAEQRGCSAA